MIDEGGLLSRRGFLGVAGAVAAGLVLPGVGSAGVRRRTGAAPGAYATHPDWAALPPVTVNHPAVDVPPGYVFAAPFELGRSTRTGFGPLIMANDGQPVWFLPLQHVQAQNLMVQRYRGRPVLTWYEGTPGGLYGGSCVIYDPAYHELKRVHGGHGLACDLHEFLLTDRGTALMAIANEVRADLTALGGPPDARVVEGVVQEVDVTSHRVLLEWHSLDHVDPSESSMTEPTPEGNVDYFHLNSIGVDTDGDLLISARHTSTVYKVSRRSGAIVWRLGGARSDFALGPGAAFAYQHDARRQADGTLTLFDNGAAGVGPPVESTSRAIRLRLDTAARRATLVREYVPEKQRLSIAMGNLQVLPDGGVFVGWGTAGGFTEFDAAGRVRHDGEFPPGIASYRFFRVPWAARPQTRPAVVLARGPAGGITATVSWNGATEVASWRVLGGPAARSLSRVASRPKAGFETVIPLATAPRRLAVEALDRRGRFLGRTATIAVR
jgi:hypothetical protein